MLAGRFTARWQLDLVELPEPQLEPAPPGAPGQILFQPVLACLCGSDLPYFNAEPPEFPAAAVGHSLHEMVGVVLATNGQRYRVGDRVLAVPVNQRGLFERYIVGEDRAIPLDPRLTPEIAVLAQPLGTVLYALKKLPLPLDQDVAIVGAGPIGQMFNAMFRNLGARKIISIDRLASRLALSTRMGATHVVNSSEEEPVAAVQKITGGAFADLVVEAVGHADQALNLAISLCRHRGYLLYFGVPPDTVEASWREAFYKNLSIHTSVNPDFARDFPLAMQFLAEGRLDLSPLVTHRYPLAQIQLAFETFRDRRDGAQKVLIDFPCGWPV